MITFFHHLLIGKMEEDAHNDEDGVEPEQPESEPQNDTPDSDSTEPAEEESAHDTEHESETDSPASSEDSQTEQPFEVEEETSDSEEMTDEQQIPEVEMVSAQDDDSDSDSDQNDETDEPPEEEQPTVEIQSESDGTSEVDGTSETQESQEEPEIPLVEVSSDTEEDQSDKDDPPEVEEKSEEQETAEVEEKPAPTEPVRPYSLGESEGLYDFVAMFDESEFSGSEHISASMSDVSGGVSKPALFEHPSSTEPSRITYKLDLPTVEENETLFLYFYTGLKDGVIFDDAERQPGGVKFCIEIAGEQCFEGVSTECHWSQNGVDVTRFAGNQVELVFITHCNVEGNSSYAWALWGQPRLLKLTNTHNASTEDRSAFRQEIQCGIAIAKYPEYQTAIFEINQDDFTPSQDIANEIYNQLENEPIELTLYVSQPKLEIVSAGVTAAVVATGEAFEIQCTIRNVGMGPLPKEDNTRLSISEVKLRRGRSTHNLKTLGVGETSTMVWYARGISRPSTINFTVSLKSRYVKGERQMKGSEKIRPALPKLETQVDSELHTFLHDQHLVLGNKHLRMILVHNGSSQQKSTRKTKGRTNTQENLQQGYEYFAIFVAKGSTYQQVATSKMVAEATYRSNDAVHTIDFVPNDVRLAGNSLGESIVYLTGEHKDVDGVNWKLQVELSLAEDTKRVKTTSRLYVDKERELLAFRGPEIFAGHKSSREKKTAALFPGLEFLEGDEPSSNTRDAAPPLNNKLVPHPYKITIPVMAVEVQKSVVGIAWNPLQTWDADAQNVSAVFASPNWYHDERNHLMALFLPTIPDWVAENTLIAKTAYQLTPEREITLECEIIADGNATILEAITHWKEAFGAPKPLEPPRSDEEELLLSRHGFMHTVWDSENRQSRHCVDWVSQNEPGFATLLWYDYLVTKSEEVKERVSEIAEKTIADVGAEGLAARGSCHILSGEFPFYYGHIDAAIGYYESEVQPIIEAQSENGSWGFQPSSEKTQILGKTDDVVLGTCAANALKLLKHARITGNKASLEAGKKALSYMDRFSVPRGAQAWECPLYEPDILAAAHAIGAYVEAHEIFGNKTYLKRAEYWAETGDPFLYHWYLPDRPGMQFASIPVFGTTFYTHSWLGVPVQWNGLVYAYYLQRLNQYAQEDKYRQVAEGITVSAMYQQWEDGELKGTYPDGFYGFCTEGKGPHINPEDIMVNVYTLSGLDPGVKTAIEGSIHLSSGATPENFTASRSGELKWSLNYAENETSYTLITGYEKSPSMIRSQRTESGDENENSAYDLPQVESLDEVTSGWRYIEEKDAILIKQIHFTAEIQFQLLK